MTDLLQPEIQQFIRRHTDDDLRTLALSKNPFPSVSWNAILNQIAGRQKAKTKLPTWYSAQNIIYPTRISVEQTSSEVTAQYKSKLVSGESLADLSGGFGVDSYYFSKSVSEVFHCERDIELHQVAKHNFKALGSDNISCETESLQFLEQSARKFDWIYVDPSRRSDAGRVFILSDCEPNVIDLMPTYFNHTDKILIKAAPLLDITAALTQLNHVASVHIVAVKNEVKELLFSIDKIYNSRPKFRTVNITPDSTDIFDFDSDSALAPLALPSTYLYEPNAAIMKSGGFEQIAIAFNLNKLHRNSHLYTSDVLVNDFPGRIFKVDRPIGYTKSDMKELSSLKANVTVRNFPDSVETIRKKWKIKDGGATYCFFTTDMNNDKIALICSKIK